MTLKALALAMAIFPATLSAQDHGGHAAPYAGFETRAIKTLSEADIDELRQGGGWGLALAAELNGLPGPVHLLELRDQIPLTPDQVAAIEAMVAAMRAEAIPAGERLIAAEAALDAAFRQGDLNPSRLRDLVAAAETARADLRFIHLSRHLATVPLLSGAQVARYNTLRGYAEDPCARVPEGHDAAMWRLHNNCR